MRTANLKGINLKEYAKINHNTIASNVSAGSSNTP